MKQPSYCVISRHCVSGFCFRLVETFLLLCGVGKKSPYLRSFTGKDKTFSPSDRFLLILSFSGGARESNTPTILDITPILSQPLRSVHSGSIRLYLSARCAAFLWRLFFSIPVLHPRSWVAGGSVGYPGGECNYREGRVEPSWRRLL